MGENIHRIHEELHSQRDAVVHGHSVHVGALHRGRAGPRVALRRVHHLGVVLHHVRVHRHLPREVHDLLEAAHR